jgi:hypothetical protein
MKCMRDNNRLWRVRQKISQRKKYILPDSYTEIVFLVSQTQRTYYIHKNCGISTLGTGYCIHENCGAGVRQIRELYLALLRPGPVNTREDTLYQSICVSAIIIEFLLISLHNL